MYILLTNFVVIHSSYLLVKRGQDGRQCFFSQLDLIGVFVNFRRKFLYFTTHTRDERHRISLLSLNHWRADLTIGLAEVGLEAWLYSQGYVISSKVKVVWSTAVDGSKPWDFSIGSTMPPSYTFASLLVLCVCDNPF